VLSISFNERQLFATTADLLAHTGASPAMSLEDLLRRGLFREPTAGGAFSPGDKAVLALSLARCLLHLFQGPWIEQPWTAKSVHFLHKSTAAEILDVHHPYVRYLLLAPNEGIEQTEPDLAKYRMVLMSFACLLLEIEVGYTIDSSLSANPEDVRSTLSNILDSRDRRGELRGPYHQAIEGCLKFKASLASVRKREPQAEVSYQIRKVIYTSVIEHLEQNLSLLRDHKRILARRNLQIEQRSIESAPFTAQSHIAAQSRNPSPSRASPTRQDPSPLSGNLIGGRLLIPSSAICGGEHLPPPPMMFDGQTVAHNHE
jgi:hypothetical protein